MLLGRDALIAKVGPRFISFHIFVNRFYTMQVSARQGTVAALYSLWVTFRAFSHERPLHCVVFPPAFFCPHELERVGELGDGGRWVCGIFQLQEQEDRIPLIHLNSRPQPSSHVDPCSHMQS